MPIRLINIDSLIRYQAIHSREKIRKISEAYTYILEYAKTFQIRAFRYQFE